MCFFEGTRKDTKFYYQGPKLSKKKGGFKKKK